MIRLICSAIKGFIVFALLVSLGLIPKTFGADLVDILDSIPRGIQAIVGAKDRYDRNIEKQRFKIMVRDRMQNDE